MATISGLAPDPRTTLGLAPAFRSVLIDGTSFLVVANTSGVKPDFDAALTFAPISTRPATTSACASAAAHISAV